MRRAAPTSRAPSRTAVETPSKFRTRGSCARARDESKGVQQRPDDAAPSGRDHHHWRNMGGSCMDRKCGRPPRPFSTYTYSFCGPVTLGVLRPQHAPRPILALTRRTRIYNACVLQGGGWSEGVLVDIYRSEQTSITHMIEFITHKTSPLSVLHPLVLAQ